MSRPARLLAVACLAYACGDSDAGVDPANPLPSIVALEPDTVMVGAQPFTLTVTGTDFVDGATVLWDGKDLPTTYRQPTQLTASVSQTQVAQARAAAVSVLNPTPGGGTSGTLPVIVVNPVPTIGSVSPSTGTIGAPAMTLVVNGSRFVDGAEVRWNGGSRATTYVTAASLRVEIPGTDLATADTAAITVANPGPGGGISAPWSYVVEYPAPEIASVQPSTVPAGSSSVTLIVTGHAFATPSTIRWNGTPLATTYEDTTRLTAPLPDSLVAAGKTVTITVQTPAPGGGTSGGLTLTVQNPLPVLDGIAPDTADANGPGFTLEVRGSGFVPTSSILLDNGTLPTQFVSASLLQSPLSGGTIMDGRLSAVRVFSPGPGGGTSRADTLVLLNPIPTVTNISPDSIEASSLGFTVAVSGSGFSHFATFRWNGEIRPTTVLSSTALLGSVTAADVAAPGTATVTVANPGPGGGVSNGATFEVIPGAITSLASLDLMAQDLLYDPTRALLYASVIGTDTVYGNRVVVIDPATAAVVTSIPVGSNPRALAMADDATLLYVALEGAAAVRRVDLAAQAATLQISLGSDPFFGPYIAEDIVVLPGAPQSFAVSRARPGVSPRHGGVAVFDDDVQRTNVTQSHTGSNRIEPSSIAGKLYGYNNETTEFGFRWLVVDASGITQDSVFRSLISGFGVEIATHGARVYASNGTVIDPEAGTPVGTFATGFGRTVAPDSVSGRVYFLNTSTGRLEAFGLETFTPVGSAVVPMASLWGFPRALRRWGTDGLAYTTGSQVVILRTALAVP